MTPSTTPPPLSVTLLHDRSCTVSRFPFSCRFQPWSRLTDSTKRAPSLSHGISPSIHTLLFLASTLSLLHSTIPSPNGQCNVLMDFQHAGQGSYRLLRCPWSCHCSVAAVAFAKFCPWLWYLGPPMAIVFTARVLPLPLVLPVALFCTSCASARVIDTTIDRASAAGQGSARGNVSASPRVIFEMILCTMCR